MLRKLILASALIAGTALAQQNVDISGADFQSGGADSTLADLGRKSAASGTRLIITGVYGQSGGSYDYYFMTFLIHRDIWASIAIVAIGAVLILGIHCYYGYTASGGPAGVGRAVGRAVRLSLITILSADLLLSLALYGGSNTLHISG